MLIIWSLNAQVHQLLKEELGNDVHALSLKLKAPSELDSGQE